MNGATRHDVARQRLGIGCARHTVRMKDDPPEVVVNPQCYIAGSAIFPTSGSANRTLTIVALAIRIADHLKTALAEFHVTISILWLGRTLPIPLNAGDRIYSAQLAGAVARQGAHVVFLGLENLRRAREAISLTSNHASDGK